MAVELGDSDAMISDSLRGGGHRAEHCKGSLVPLDDDVRIERNHATTRYFAAHLVSAGEAPAVEAPPRAASRHRRYCVTGTAAYRAKVTSATLSGSAFGMRMPPGGPENRVTHDHDIRPVRPGR